MAKVRLKKIVYYVWPEDEDAFIEAVGEINEPEYAAAERTTDVELPVRQLLLQNNGEPADEEKIRKYLVREEGE